MRVVVIDYGVNNLRSVVRAIEAAGHTAVVTDAPLEVRSAERVVLPGVGSFARAARHLQESGISDTLRDIAHEGRPVMGICLGQQLFFESSEEGPGVPGIGLLPGHVRRFDGGLPVPHVGWAEVTPTTAGVPHAMLQSLFAGGPQFFYHVHSYRAADLPDDISLATADYGGAFPTIVGQGNVIGVQFHPEKSQKAGIALMDAFARWRP